MDKRTRQRRRSHAARKRKARLFHGFTALFGWRNRRAPFPPLRFGRGNWGAFMPRAGNWRFGR